MKAGRRTLVWVIASFFGGALPAHAQEPAASETAAPAANGGTPSVATEADSAPTLAADGGATSPAIAQPPLRLTTPPARVQLMDRWLAHLNDSARGARTSRAVWSFVNAGLAVSAGIEVMVSEQRTGNQLNWERVALSGFFFGFAAAEIAGGIVAASARETDEERYARWRELHGVDDVALARFEGELAAEAQRNRRQRLSRIAASIGIALGGGAILGLTPTAKLKSDWAAFSYVLGGAELAVGIWEFILACTGESKNERAYRLYSAGTSPEQASFRVRVVPTLAARGGGLGLTGSF